MATMNTNFIYGKLCTCTVYEALLYFAWADQRVQQFYNLKLVVIELWLGSYRTVVLLTHFIKETCLFVQ